MKKCPDCNIAIDSHFKECPCCGALQLTSIPFPITSLNGTDIWCLSQLKLTPGNLLTGHCVKSLGIAQSIFSRVSNLIGGEVPELTEIFNGGRKSALRQMEQAAKENQASGILSVAQEIITHGSNLEFLAKGAGVHGSTSEGFFSSANCARDLLITNDLGFQPKQALIESVIYSTGSAGGIMGALKTMGQGEVKEYTELFNQTRQSAVERLEMQAASQGFSAILGITVKILPLGFSPAKELVLLGTGCSHPALNNTEVISSGISPYDLWNLSKAGYFPVKLLIQSAVISLGVVNGLASTFKAAIKNDLGEMANLVRSARASVLVKMEDLARQAGAYAVIGTDFSVHDLGNGLMELCATGTAIKRFETIQPLSDVLPQQVIFPRNIMFCDQTDWLHNPPK